MPTVIFKVSDLDIELIKEILGNISEEKEVIINGERKKVLKLNPKTQKDIYAFLAIIGLYNTKVRM
ncbi:MAG: hypothetical protein DRN95_04480 [Candidatus Hydrothermarchaeota archaeon]|nr:MAG: hypothetical protein DRN95_04480 [Candidatus Hydrothermarchaeota archaeon]